MFIKSIQCYLPEVIDYIIDNETGKFIDNITDLNFDGSSIQIKTYGEEPKFLEFFLSKEDIKKKNKIEKTKLCEENIEKRLELWTESLISNDSKASNNKDNTITSFDIVGEEEDSPTVRIQIWHNTINFNQITTFTCRFIKNININIWENVPSSQRDFLKAYFKEQIIQRKNIFFVGNMNTGKSVTMSKIIEFIPKGDTIYSLQDTFDMGLQKLYGSSKFIYEQTYNNSKIKLKDFLKSSRRADAKWVFLAEARDEKEMSIIYYLLNSAQSVLTTMHARDGKSAITYLANTLMFDDKYSKIPIEVIKSTVANTLDVVVTMALHPGEKTPKISKVEEILGYSNGNIDTKEIYSYITIKKEKNEKI